MTKPGMVARKEKCGAALQGELELEGPTIKPTSAPWTPWIGCNCLRVVLHD